MAKLPSKKFPKELTVALRQAEALAADDRLISAFHAAADDPRLRAKSLNDPGNYLRERGIEMPATLQLQFVEVELPGRPYPLGDFFNIIMTKCRSYWVREKGEDGKVGKWQLVTVCFGLEIFPKRWPWVATP